MPSYPQSGSVKCPRCGALVDVYPDKLIPESAGMGLCTEPGLDPLSCPIMIREMQEQFGFDPRKF